MLIISLMCGTINQSQVDFVFVARQSRWLNRQPWLTGSIFFFFFFLTAPTVVKQPTSSDLWVWFIFCCFFVSTTYAGLIPSHQLLSRTVRSFARSLARCGTSIRPRRAMTEHWANVGWSPAVSHKRRDKMGDRPSVTRSPSIWGLGGSLRCRMQRRSVGLGIGGSYYDDCKSPEWNKEHIFFYLSAGIMEKKNKNRNQQNI